MAVIAPNRPYEIQKTLPSASLQGSLSPPGPRDSPSLAEAGMSPCLYRRYDGLLHPALYIRNAQFWLIVEFWVSVLGLLGPIWGSLNFALQPGKAGYCLSGFVRAL